MTYSRTPYCIGEGRTVLSCGRTAPQPVALKPDLPGAVILTLSAGAIFGLWVGTLIVSFASAIGISRTSAMFRPL